MSLWCSFPQALYTNGRECSIKYLNGGMATPQLIMECSDLKKLKMIHILKLFQEIKKYVNFGNGYNNSGGTFWPLP